MLDEKTMVSDALAGVNGELVRYGEMISQTENKELKQKLKQIQMTVKCPRKNFIRLPAKKVIMFLPPKLPIRKSHM